MARKARARGTWQSLKSSHSFRDFVLDQLSGIRDVRARPMFGGLGLYAGDAFFGLVANDVLYLKTDDTNRAAYETAGCTPFRPYAGKPASKSYYSVPVDVLESAPALCEWARTSIAIAASKPKTGRARA